MTTKTTEIIPTGFPTLDSLFGGLKPAQLVILASRPSVGKTSFALSLARNITVENNIPAAYFSLEKGAECLARKFLCQVEHITLSQAFGMQKCDINMEELNEKISSIPLYIDDTPAIKPEDILAKSERLVYENGVKVIIVDYVQLVSTIEGRRKEITREEEIRKVVMRLKQIAKKLNVPVVGLFQMPRLTNYGISESRIVPNLSELRALPLEFLEKSIDMVWLLHCIRNEWPGNDENKAELIVAHNAHSEYNPVIEMRFDTEYGRFIDWMRVRNHSIIE